MARIFVMGAGAFGSTLATLADRAGQSAILWSHSEAEAVMINRHRVVPRLPDLPLSPRLGVTADLAAARDADLLIIATPAQAIRSSLERLRPYAAHTPPILIAAKGIERETGYLMSEIAAEVWPEASCAILSGPNFADEIMRGLPAASLIAAPDLELAHWIAQQLQTEQFRPYVGGDRIGAQIGGAVKNIVAIACGLADGLGLGENARAALMTRGLAEMARLGVGMGARLETFMGLSGAGDLMLTCVSPKSRNRLFGRDLLDNYDRPPIKGIKLLSEGVMTAEALQHLCRRANLDLALAMPICNGVRRVIARQANPQEEMAALLARPLTFDSASDLAKG